MFAFKVHSFDELPATKYPFFVSRCATHYQLIVIALFIYHTCSAETYWWMICNFLHSLCTQIDNCSLVFCKYLIRILALLATVLTNDFCDFRHSLLENIGIVSLSKPRSPSFKSVSRQVHFHVKCNIYFMSSQSNVIGSSLCIHETSLLISCDRGNFKHWLLNSP